jgi:cytochrome o ubiquinol oxidase subunit 2
MSRKKILAGGLLALGIIAASSFYLRQANFAVLQPAGEIGEKERNLIYISLLLAIVVVVPVFVMLFAFTWKYREGNTKAKYQPEFQNSRKLEAVWWGIPFIIILILSVLTWNSSHSLDPNKSLNSKSKPMHIQVIALQWKWLFIYPEQKFASVNFVQFPINTPVDFEITSDAPMNSFWIPQLGGQIYAMSGMSTHLHLTASKAGDYSGRSANISGVGFAHMTFTARASSQSNFKNWSASLHSANQALDLQTYNKLAQPDIPPHPIYYSWADTAIYNTVVDKYMSPHSASSSEPMHTGDHDGMGM